jgi:cation transport regulator ChaC
MLLKMNARVGILAYGSLIVDPREEIQSATIEIKKGIVTPFKVEFARTSRTRGGAPTLVPVDIGGAQVRGWIFVLDVPEEEAANRLWRRETDRVGSGMRYEHPQKVGPDSVVVDRLKNFEDVGIVLYTRISSNIPDVNAEKLASLAIESAQTLDNERDGISYLIRAKANGIQTPLSDGYEQEIIRRLKASDLEDALRKVRSLAKVRMRE